MESKLQELTASIYREGVEKAQAEAHAIISQAQEQAKAILAEAQSEKDRILASTKVEIRQEEARTLAELKLATDNALKKFRDELTRVVERSILAQPIKSAMNDNEFIAKLISSIVAQWTSSKPGTDLMAVLPENMKTDFDSWFATKAKGLLDKGLSVSFDGRFADGFRIGPVDGSYVVSFTEKDISSLFQAHLKTRTRELLFPVI